MILDLETKRILHITHITKFSNLRKLNLSYNTLTGCVSSLLSSHNTGLLVLVNLNLTATSLNQNDLQHLTYLTQTHKLPGLEQLYIEFNGFCEMETDVEHLIEACVTHHQRELRLGIIL